MSSCQQSKIRPLSITNRMQLQDIKSIFYFFMIFGLKHVFLAEETRNKLIVVMLDGCRHDYFSRNESNHPGFQHFKTEGVVAEYVQPIYPSSSLESWTSIVTGLYPDKHGILGNYMYDQEEDDFFDLHIEGSTNQSKWWTEHIPIWTTLTQNGNKFEF